MFGEEIIVTNRTLKLDPKKRIVIPAETKVEANEKLFIMFNPLKEYLRIYGEQDFEKVLASYEELFTKLRTENKITSKEYRYYRRYLYATLCFPEETTDKQHRITIPKSALEHLKINSSIYAIGRENHLELYKDEETYQSILTKKK